MSCLLLTLHRTEYCFKGVWEAASASLVLLLSYPWPHVLVASRLTLASVAGPWLVDPRVGGDKAYITTLACNRHLPIVEPSYATREAGQQYLVFYFTFVRVYYLTTVEGKEFLSGSSLSNLDYGSRYNDFSLVSGMCILAITISVVLLPCAVSSTWTWVNQLLTLVHNWNGKGPPPTYTSRLWVTWDIYMLDLLWHRGAVLSGLGIFWKRWVSRSCLGVFLCCFVFVCCLCCFVNWRHLAFCSHLFSNMWE